MGFYDQDGGDLLGAITNPNFLARILGMSETGVPGAMTRPQAPPPPMALNAATRMPLDPAHDSPPVPPALVPPQHGGGYALAGDGMMPPGGAPPSGPPPQMSFAPGNEFAPPAMARPSGNEFAPSPMAAATGNEFARAQMAVPTGNEFAPSPMGLRATITQTPQPPGVNAPVQAPPLPPMMGGGGPPSMGTGGGLAAAMGLRGPDGWRSAMAGVGKGLTAVGNAPSGAPAGKMFAAGAGGGLSGATGDMDRQDLLARKDKNDLFSQSSTAFDAMLKEKAAGNTEAYRAAQGDYLRARAESLRQMTQTGGKGSQAYQNTPEYKVLRVEENAAKWEKNQQIILQRRWQLNGATPEQQSQDMEALTKKTEAFKRNLYKQSGIDPKQAEKTKDMGLEPSNPFTTKNMGVDQFHKMVPMGGWYDTGKKYGPDGIYRGKDLNGNEFIRRGPPGGNMILQRTSEPAGAQAPQATAPAAPTYDDMLAMSPAA